MTLLADYRAMRKREMDELRRRNPKAIPELGYVFGAFFATLCAGIFVSVWWITITDLWPLMLQQWPFPGVIDLLLIATFVLVCGGFPIVAGLMILVDVLDRIEKFRDFRLARR